MDGSPDQQPDQSEPQPMRRLTALEVRKKHGIRLAIFLALFFWFAYDGWHNPKFQKPEKRFDMWFNRIGAYVLAAFTLYHGTMFTSAALTVRRQQETGDVERPPDNQAPPGSA